MGIGLGRFEQSAMLEAGVGAFWMILMMILR
jgi:hypothetical protein